MTKKIKLSEKDLKKFSKELDKFMSEKSLATIKGGYGNSYPNYAESTYVRHY